MNKFLTVSCLILVAPALSGALQVQQRPSFESTVPASGQPASLGAGYSKAVEGRVHKIDAGIRTIILHVNARVMLLSWDGNTKFKEAGHAVRPSALVPGATVTVYYAEGGGRNVASAIIIAPPAGKTKRK
jgi:hypothetical protein